jgi:hypothetical protein
VVVQMQAGALNSQLSPIAQTPTIRISEWHWLTGMSYCFMGKKQTLLLNFIFIPQILTFWGKWHVFHPVYFSTLKLEFCELWLQTLDASSSRYIFYVKGLGLWHQLA